MRRARHISVPTLLGTSTETRLNVQSRPPMVSIKSHPGNTRMGTFSNTFSTTHHPFRAMEDFYTDSVISVGEAIGNVPKDVQAMEDFYTDSVITSS
ncbi:hypothetical protein BHE74_00028593 [Ensete ventricosum]|nr:hypothetical protein BHE74_00028593 [Ensete ventricosum]